MEDHQHLSGEYKGTKFSLTGYTPLIILSVLLIALLLWWLDSARLEEERRVRDELAALRKDITQQFVSNREMFLDVLRDLKLEVSLAASRMDLIILQQSRRVRTQQPVQELP